MANGLMESPMTKFNARLKLANKIPADKQWWMIESVLQRAETLGPTPEIKQVNPEDGKHVLIFFQMTPEQRKDFLDTYAVPQDSQPSPEGEAA